MAETERGKKKAAALKYDPKEDSIPILTAFGEGFLAEKIVETAQNAGVPVVPDPSLASLLSKMSVGDEIPPALYEIVARVLIYVGEMDKSYGESVRAASGWKPPR